MFNISYIGLLMAFSKVVREFVTPGQPFTHHLRPANDEMSRPILYDGLHEMRVDNEQNPEKCGRPERQKDVHSEREVFQFLENDKKIKDNRYKRYTIAN